MALRKLGIPDPEEHAARNYLVYRRLCLPKHLNPVFQRRRGLKLHGRQATVKTGPDTFRRGCPRSLVRSRTCGWLGLRSHRELCSEPCAGGASSRSDEKT